jgi:hypothetical protein
MARKAVVLERALVLTVLACFSCLALVLPSPDAQGAQPKYRGCRLQKAQSFLKRSSFIRKGRLHGQRHARTLRYRAEKYGSIEGLGLERHNPDSVSSQIVSVRFMGLPVAIHKKVAKALPCVESRIRKICKRRADEYRAVALGGFRKTNTFRNGELSNHLFGIAIDVDPERNPCCGCVEPWPDHPACRGSVDTVYKRTAMPRCWVWAFERYGFYWLGRDPELRDTMHFEFLGDPDRIEVYW